MHPTESENDFSQAMGNLLAQLPTQPGVYLMKDRKGQVIYVGKAQNLRNRVRSYFTKSGDDRQFVALLEKWVADIETMVTHNEKEALLLENTLIKRYKPRFNIKLVDDKNYLVLRLDPKARYPRLEVGRRIQEDGARYFGPYHSAGSCRQTLDVVNRHFKLRTCTDAMMNQRTRPCLQYQINRCDAPCVLPVSQEQYAEQVNDVTLFLQGKNAEVLNRLQERMQEAAVSQNYETAAVLRDQIHALEKTLEEQKVVSTHFVDQDVFGYYRQADEVEIAVLQVRQGKLMGRRVYLFRDQEFPDEEVLSSFVNLYYDAGGAIPQEILLPLPLEDQVAKEEWLQEQMRGTGRGRVKVLAPKRGDKQQLVELANKNAAAAYHSQRHKTTDVESSLAKLQKRLGLGQMPRRMECFDISHLQGTNAVASRVVFVDGEPLRSEYRMFAIKNSRNDDFASMYEAMSRRLRRALDVSSSEDPSTSAWRLPDLFVIDGGKGQLASALAAIKDVGLDHAPFDIVGLAKEREDESGSKQPDRVFVPKAKDPIKLRPNTLEMFVLSRLRDEAHRFAVTFHKKKRAKATIRSALADVPGIGPKRQQALLKAFGSLKKLRNTPMEAIAAVPGIGLAAAQAILQHFGQSSSEDAASLPEKEPSSLHP